MNIFLILAFLFFLGSMLGWSIELLYRRFLSRANPERRWINPGFCTGPYLPLYGSGLCVLYLAAQAGERLQVCGSGGRILIILIMGCSMTLLEYMAGIVSLRVAHVRLWDYTQDWGNIQGLICPKFSLIWTCCSALYYLFIHNKILYSLVWLSENLAFSFFIGLFFGVFLIDVCYNAHVAAEIRRYAAEKQLVVRYENLKAQIKRSQELAKEKTHFLFPFRSTHSLAEHLRESQDIWEARVRRLRRERRHRK